MLSEIQTAFKMNMNKVNIHLNMRIQYSKRKVQETLIIAVLFLNASLSIRQKSIWASNLSLSSDSGFKAGLLQVTMLLAVLKALSEGVLVDGMHKWCFATKLGIFGRRLLVFL